MIKVNTLGKHYGRRTAVDGVDFSAQCGEVVGLLGPNGAGKSTTLKMITGYLEPDCGSASIGDFDIVQSRRQAQALLGYLPEGAPCYADMKVLPFLRFVAAVRGLRGRWRRRAVDRVIDQLSLREVAGQRIDTLSKGFTRRVGLAQALVHDPAVLILDEPTDGLDPNQKRQVRDLLAEIAQTKTILISTHILEEVGAMCSRVLVLANGMLVADERPEVLAARSRYRGAVTLTLADEGVGRAASRAIDGGNGAGLDAGMVDQLVALPGVQGVEPDPKVAGRVTLFPVPDAQIVVPLLAAIQGHGWQVAELHTEQGRLDDVFQRLTKVDAQAMAS